MNPLTAGDAEIYEEWKNAFGYRKEQKLTALLERLEGATMAAANTYRAAPLPFPVVQTEARRLTVEAIKDWQPSGGMALASYVSTIVRNRLNRYVIDHQNVARIPENRVRLIGPMREAETELTSRFGRPPTTDEIADHMGVAMKHITKLRGMMHADLLESTGSLSDIEQFANSADLDRVMLGYYTLSPDEKNVFDYSVGAHGRKKLEPGEIASKLDMSSVRVSQLKKQIADKLKPYLP